MVLELYIHSIPSQTSHHCDIHSHQQSTKINIISPTAAAAVRQQHDKIQKICTIQWNGNFGRDIHIIEIIKRIHWKIISFPSYKWMKMILAWYWIKAECRLPVRWWWWLCFPTCALYMTCFSFSLYYKQLKLKIHN